MSSHLRTTDTTALSEDESSASLEATPPQQLSLFEGTLTTSDPFEAYEVMGPGKLGKVSGNYLQSQSPAG